MLRILLRATGDLADRAILKILLRSLLITLVLFGLSGLALGWALAGTDPCGWIDAEGSCVLGRSTGGLGAAMVTLLAAWLLFPAVAVGVITAFSDRIVARVEAIHYPAAMSAARDVGLLDGAMLGLKSTARLILYNLVALPLYLLLLLTGIGTVIAFLLVNGLAIGRDFGEMVAARHGDRASRRAWIGATRGDRAMIGILIAAIFLIPILNLVAPILGAAMATHLYHRRDAHR